MTVRILTGDCREVLKTLSDQSVHCIVCSPPYFGLRDYGTGEWEGGDAACSHEGRAAKRNAQAQPGSGSGAGNAGYLRDGLASVARECACGARRIDRQIGLEATPDAFVAELVAVFRECRRVLRDDGVMFLNLGDSYWSSGVRQTGRNDTDRETPGGRGGSFRGGVRRAIACDTAGKELEGSPERGCLCQSLCDACRAAYQIGKSHSGSLRASTPLASNSESSRERKGLLSVRPPRSGSIHLGGRTEAATLDQPPSPRLDGVPPLASQVSTIGESSPPLQGDFRQSVPPSECQLCGCSLGDCAQASAHKEACTCDTTGGASAGRRIGRGVSDSAYLDFTTASLKPKDLIGIPWMVAFALRADGWYLRSDIIWSKANPMPESVRDRPTKSHEYLFLLTKKERYYYDPDAIKETAAPASEERYRYSFGGAKSEALIEANKTGIGQRTRPSGEREYSGDRNRRTVWHIATQPFSDWGETVRQVRVAWDAAVDGKKRKASTDCPLHAGQGRWASNDTDDGRAGDRQCRNRSTDGRRVQEQLDGFAPIETRREPETAQRNSDSPDQSCSASAIPRNMESRRTGLDLATSSPCIASAQTLSRTPDTSEGRGLSGSAVHMPASSSGAVEMVDSQASQTDGRTARTSVEQGSSSASHASDCTCEYYIEITEKNSHFATFPPDLIEPCIKAGTSEKGCCAKCGAPWVREVEREGKPKGRSEGNVYTATAYETPQSAVWGSKQNLGGDPRPSKTLGWSRGCLCAGFENPVPCTVLDPFGGAGTTGLVADRLQRNAILIELNSAYAEMARKRLTKDAGMFAEVA